MTGVAVVLAGLLVAAAVVGVGVVLHRDLGQISEHLERSGHQPELHRYLDQLWNEVRRFHDERAAATDARLRDIETALSQVRQAYEGLTENVNRIVPWVRLWSESGGPR